MVSTRFFVSRNKKRDVIRLFHLCHRLSAVIFLSDELFKFEVAVTVRTNVNFFPRCLCKHHAHVALRVQTMTSVHDFYVIRALGSDLHKIENICCSGKIYLIDELVRSRCHDLCLLIFDRETSSFGQRLRFHLRYYTRFLGKVNSSDTGSTYCTFFRDSNVGVLCFRTIKSYIFCAYLHV